MYEYPRDLPEGKSEAQQPVQTKEGAELCQHLQASS